MRKKILSLLLCVAMLLAFSACGLISEKADAIGEQLNHMQEQYAELQKLYGEMKDMLLGQPDSGKVETQTVLIGIETQLQTYESILEDEPEDYYDLDGLREIEREMQSTKAQIEAIIESGSVQSIIDKGEAFGFYPDSAGNDDSDNLAVQKTMRLQELMAEISAAMKPGNESWETAYRDLNLRYQQFSMGIAFEAYENGGPGNDELLNQLDGFIEEYEEMLASIS